MTPALTTAQMLDAIRRHSQHLTDAARGHFRDPVAACPGWTVADLIDHVVEVQWSWGTRAIQRSTAQEIGGDQSAPPTGLSESESLALCAETTRRMVSALDGDDAHQRIPVWTWAPDNQSMGFITRHQVQEAAVHDCDAAQAGATEWTIEPAVAADCVDEFLTYSICSPHYPAPPGTAALGGPVTLAATDTGDRWIIADGDQAGTLAVTRDDTASGDVIEATAGELLLWLYGRVELDSLMAGVKGSAEINGPVETAGRLRALMYTD